MPYAEPALAGTAGSLFAFSPRASFRPSVRDGSSATGWSSEVVRHLTDFRPFPNARTTDVSTIEARTQRELSHRPTRRSENTTPRTQGLCSFGRPHGRKTPVHSGSTSTGQESGYGEDPPQSTPD